MYEDEIIDQFLDAEVMGRRRRRPTRQRVRSRRRPSTAFRGQASGVSVATPSEGRLLTLGLDSVANVAAAAQATVNSQPQVVFRPDRLSIPLSVSVNFLVNDLKIGKNSMLISATGIPAEAFSHDAAGVGMKMDTAQVSQIISITVTNLDAVNPHRFSASLIGPSVE
jgi:hypothetical protein